ncbi:hypothetical protein OKA05_09715 [Luteolibacter arcticus]|uniref:Knr4/Smi1-like domain-containing protein n=1 Tax=Luteolibacter arcticus TaxID=1581411 RepID=A0ABT3GGT4_9BACT|nr:hypothetical protein [Luteolibacter arcticus]MCW1922826.1 hypothetical protein [Luteolibacter arcticus]
MKSEVLELKELIDRLRAADQSFYVFGAKSHRYEIGPPLPESELSSYESRYGITLPEDYRLYLSMVGDGNGRKLRPGDGLHTVTGAGPGHGIYPLSETVNSHRVHLPFPFSRKVELPEGCEGDLAGAIEISTQGCGTRVNLVVAGPEFGKVWEGNEYYQFAPTNLNFLSWMGQWAENALTMLSKWELVKKLSPGMTKEQVVEVVGGEWRERKSGRWWFFEGPTIPAQIVLSGENGVVSVIDPWPFI